MITLFLSAGIYFLVKETTEKQLEVEKKDISVASIKMFVDKCLQNTAQESLVLTSVQGGYYKVPEPANNQIFLKIPYYFDLGQTHFPRKTTIEEQIGNYVLEKLPACLNDMVIFKKQGFKFKEDKKKIKVSLDNKITFELNYPLTIEKANIKKNLNKFVHTIDIDFQRIYNLINETKMEHQKNPNYVPVGYLSSAAYENKFTFDLSYLKNNVVIYSYIFDNYQIDKKNYTFVFAGRYNWSDLILEKSIDYVQEVVDQYCYVGDNCYYDLNIYEDNYSFVDYSNLFEISPGGLISFVPQQQNIGNHSILIKVMDSAAKQYLSFALEILALNNPPLIKEVDERTALVNLSFIYWLNVTDPEADQLIFYENTNLFDISDQGLINFTPLNNSLGFHSIEITVSDGEFNDTGWLYLDIKNESRVNESE